MRKLIFLSCLLLLVGAAHAQGGVSARDQMIARAKKGLQSWRDGSKIWTARAKQVPDYGFEADTWNYDGDSWEGTIYLQYPGRYAIRCRRNLGRWRRG